MYLQKEERSDFRQSCVFTIDPVDAEDLDDAVSCERLGDGQFRVSVHIADVSYVVTEGSDLDKFAAKRGTSVYMVNKVTNETTISINFMLICVCRWSNKYITCLYTDCPHASSRVSK